MKPSSIFFLILFLIITLFSLMNYSIQYSSETISECQKMPSCKMNYTGLYVSIFICSGFFLLFIKSMKK